MSEPRQDGTPSTTTPMSTLGDSSASTLPTSNPRDTVTTKTVETTTEPARPVAPTSATSASVPTSAAPARSAGVSTRRTRKARLRLARLDPWSVMKTAFLFSIAGGIAFWVLTYVVWGVIGSSGLFDSINSMISSVVEAPGQQGKFKIETYVSTNKVLGLAALLAVVDIVIFTALATLGSFLYNLSATMLGGIEVTLAED